MKKRFFVLAVIFSLLFSLVSCPPEAETPLVKEITDTVTVNGTVDKAIETPAMITVELEKGKFKAITELDVNTWFSTKVQGLEYKLQSVVAENATSLTIVISGTPRAESTESIGNITIPKECFVYATDNIVVSLGLNSKYNIEKQKQEPTNPDTPDPDNPNPDTPSEENVEPVAKDISDVIIVNGVVNNDIIPVSVSIELSKGKFKAITDTNVVSWFKDGTVNGLTYNLTKAVSEGDTSLTIRIAGTPSEASSAQIGNITIPKESFVYATADLVVELYDTDKYNIQAAKVVNGDMKLITIDGEIPQAVDYTNNIATIDFGDYNGDLYLVISNPTTGDVSSPAVSGFTTTTKANPYRVQSQAMLGNVNYLGDEKNIGFKDKVYEVLPEIKLEDAINKNVVKATTNDFVSPYKDKKVGDKVDLFVTDENEDFASTPATIRLKRTVNTAFGNKTLIIAVQDSMWNTPLKDSELSTSATIDQAFVDAQADAFLKDGSNNDIYDYITAIYGEEWGWNNKMDENYISDTDEILIFFAQIEGQTSGTGATAGYFTNGHNYQNGKDGTNTSNQAICLTMDAYYNAYNPESSLTTMAHEFQHAIHYYQRVAKKGQINYEYQLLPGDPLVMEQKANKSIRSEIWVNEMFAALAEDAVAEFIGVSGPGYNELELGGPAEDDSSLKIAYNGRIPQYFKAQRYTLTNWSETSRVNSLHPYGLVYSFGSYLVRNYGVDFIKNYMQSDMLEYPNAKLFYSNGFHWDYGESNAHNIVVDAVQKASGNSSITWSDLVRGWGASILLSEDFFAVKPYKLSRFDYTDYMWWTEPYREYGLKIPSLDYFSYATTSGQMWEGGSSLITIGPYIFNQYTDRLFSNKDSSFRANTNTFLKLDEDVSGTKTYTINGSSDLKYTFVLKTLYEEE